MYRKMLVLLDGSELAEVVFRYAQELSGRLNIDLELLNVCPPQESAQLPMRRAYIQQKAELLCAGAEEIRRASAATTTGECIQARGTVVVGRPAEEILKYVDENDIDLVMMSTHGSSGVSDWDLGSVANKVAHASRVPVWLVPTELREEVIEDTLPKRTLVIPVSGTKQSEAAIPHALTVARQRGAESELVLLHVLDVGYLALTRAALEEKEAERTRMLQYLKGLEQSIRDQGFNARSELLVGEPASTVIDYLKDNPAQLLAMATRGHSGLSRMIFGSVTETVLHLVKKTPLLLVCEPDS